MPACSADFPDPQAAVEHAEHGDTASARRDVAADGASAVIPSPRLR